MQFFYNILLEIVSFILPITAIFSKKMKLFVKGRKDVFNQIVLKIRPKDKIIWIHCASLGEFEQGRPVIEGLKIQHPEHKILLTFFSPSGFEVRKNYEKADLVLYLPIDTKNNAEKFVKLAHPQIAIFIKYEFWRNYLFALEKDKIPTFLISGIFRENQLFFKPYFRWYRKSLRVFMRFFVQDEGSQKLLNAIGLQNTTVSGDTRFDRVAELLHTRRKMHYLDFFKKDHFVLLAGSVWQKDLDILVPFINKNEKMPMKFIIAPHNIDEREINHLQKTLKVKYILQSQIETQIENDIRVIIMDSVGWLSSAYAYCDIAYVGGGFGVGIHNILEAATYGVPILFGPNYNKFNEARDLIELGGAMCVNNSDSFEKNLFDLTNSAEQRNTKGTISRKYVEEHLGATKKILGYLKDVL